MAVYDLINDLIDEMANNPKVAHYLDIPIQHGSDKILKAMFRRDNAELITSRLEMIRKAMPDCIIRTTVMVGFPGETEEDFRIMKENLRKWKFDRLGCFILPSGYFVSLLFHFPFFLTFINW